MRQQIIQNNYLYVPEFISRGDALSLAKEFKEHCTKFNLVGDSQSFNSSAKYDFLPFLRLLVEKVPEVTALLGEKVLPTYTYARIYRRGSVLERHRDRHACEISFTLKKIKCMS